jgi:hypothetical protein
MVLAGCRKAGGKGGLASRTSVHPSIAVISVTLVPDVPSSDDDRRGDDGTQYRQAAVYPFFSSGALRFSTRALYVQERGKRSYRDRLIELLWYLGWVTIRQGLEDLEIII